MKRAALQERTSFYATGGFTLVELMIAVAIISILAAIAIPLYMNYLGNAKVNTCASHFSVASSFVASELKKDPADRTTNIVIELNRGGRSDPYNPANDAFKTGIATGTAGDCQVGIVLSGGGVNLATAVVGSTVDITGADLGNASTNYTVVHYNVSVE